MTHQQTLWKGWIRGPVPGDEDAVTPASQQQRACWCQWVCVCVLACVRACVGVFVREWVRGRRSDTTWTLSICLAQDSGCNIKLFTIYKFISHQQSFSSTWGGDDDTVLIHLCVCVWYEWIRDTLPLLPSFLLLFCRDIHSGGNTTNSPEIFWDFTQRLCMCVLQCKCMCTTVCASICVCYSVCVHALQCVCVCACVCMYYSVCVYPCVLRCVCVCVTHREIPLWMEGGIKRAESYNCCQGAEREQSDLTQCSFSSDNQTFNARRPEPLHRGPEDQNHKTEDQHFTPKGLN